MLQWWHLLVPLLASHVRNDTYTRTQGRGSSCTHRKNAGSKADRSRSRYARGTRAGDCDSDGNRTTHGNALGRCEQAPSDDIPDSSLYSSCRRP